MFEVAPQTSRDAGRRFAVVLSDVHVGTNAPTCWYQAAVHERPLTEALAWIVARRSAIREVVLLGDLFDFWTYPPSVRPPTMADIIAANPTLLGPTGPLAAVVRAFPGEVRLMPGNHDLGLTAADVDQLNRSLGGNLSRGERIDLVTAPWRAVTGLSGARTVFSHGHHSCMFNAPDPRSRWGTIPIGQVITRAIGYELSRSLRPGETSADRRNNGNPKARLAQAVGSAWRHPDDLAALVLDYFCRTTGMAQTARITMPDGTTTTAQESARVFSGLFAYWVRHEGRSPEAWRAAAAEYPGGSHLAWFAQRLAMQTGSDLAVMGHTHSVVGGVTVSPVNYVNGGYMCVARPDAPGTQMTFTQVDLERATAQVMAVENTGGSLRVVPARAPVLDSAIISPQRDYSCYARIENHTDRPLRLVSVRQESASFWPVRPPVAIAPHALAHIWLSDTLGVRGSGGGFTYTDGARSYDFALECPTVFGNVVRSPVAEYATKVGNRHWRLGGVEGSGYPVQARFYIGAPVPVGVGGGPATGPAHAGGRPPAPTPSGSRPGGGSPESPFVVATRAILDRGRTPRERGVVMCVAHLLSRDGAPLVDPTTEPAAGPGAGPRLKNPPNHLLSPDVQTITVDGTNYRYVWIQPNVPPVSPPNSGGVAFLPDAGSAATTIVTFNVAGLDDDFRRGCRNGHHAEMQVVGFVNAQPARWRANLAKLELLNRSRRGPDWGYSACNACLSDLAAFLTAFGSPRPRASISWERLYDKNARCGHPTDAANIARLVAAGWDQPQGKRPAGTRWPAVPPRAPSVRGTLPRRVRTP